MSCFRTTHLSLLISACSLRMACFWPAYGLPLLIVCDLLQPIWHWSRPWGCQRTDRQGGGLLQTSHPPVLLMCTSARFAGTAVAAPLLHQYMYLATHLYSRFCWLYPMTVSVTGGGSVRIVGSGMAHKVP